MRQLFNGKILKTQTDDGYELDAVLVEPKIPTKKVIIHFHGKEGDFLQNHFIYTMAKEYPKEGFAFMTASHRGRSYIADILRKSTAGYQYTQMGSAFDIFEDCVHDIDAWVELLIELGYKKIILHQHSTPQKILWYTYRKKPKSVSVLILLSPADWVYLFEKYVPNYQKNLELAEKMVKSGKGEELMPVNLWSNCPVSAKTFYNWGHKGSNFQVFNFSHPEKGLKYFSKIKMSMLAVLAEDDFAVGRPSQECLKILEENTTATKFATKVIKDTTHSYLGKEDELAQTVLDWLKSINI